MQVEAHLFTRGGKGLDRVRQIECRIFHGVGAMQLQELGQHHQIWQRSVVASSLPAARANTSANSGEIGQAAVANLFGACGSVSTCRAAMPGLALSHQACAWARKACAAKPTSRR